MQTLIEKYFDLLPLKDQAHIVSLAEGDTPLIPLKHMMEMLGNQFTIYAKVEGFNPTGSFKDRGMTVAISKALEEGAKAVLCASTGNTSASAAAYAAKAKMKAFVLIPEGKIAYGKLAQALIYGAEIVQINGNFDEAMQMVKAFSQALPIALVNSVNPYRLQGQQTASFEVVDQLGDAPDYHILPVGNAGNISAYWMGYKQYNNLKKAARTPTMVGYQAAGAAPFIQHKPIETPETIATAIRIGHPQSWDLALNAVKESNGWFAAVSDDDILAAQRILAQCEGIFCEPASAASIAGLLADCQKGRFKTGSTIVCTLTGNGLKDPDIVMQQYQSTLTNLKAQQQDILKHLEEKLCA